MVFGPWFITDQIQNKNTLIYIIKYRHISNPQCYIVTHTLHCFQENLVYKCGDGPSSPLFDRLLSSNKSFCSECT